MKKPNFIKKLSDQKVNWKQWGVGILGSVAIGLIFRFSDTGNPPIVGDTQGYRSVVENPESMKWLLIENAKRDLRLGDFLSAQKLLEGCISSHGEFGEAYLLLGKTQQLSNDYEKAENSFLHAIKLNPNNVDYYTETIDFYFDWNEKAPNTALVAKLEKLWKEYRNCQFCESNQSCIKLLDDIPISFAEGKTHILSIGIDQYAASSSASLRPLAYAEHDAEMVAEGINSGPFLGLKGSETILLGKNATKENIMRSLNAMTDLTLDDRLVIYFAGHGFSRNGKRFIVPYDAQLGDPSSVISLAELGEIYAPYNLRHKPILVLDACSEELPYFDNTFGISPSEDPIPIDRISEGDNLILLSGTSVGEKGLETGVLNGGLFTRTLISSVVDLSHKGDLQNASLLDLYLVTNEKMSHLNRKFSVNQNIDFGRGN